jgi:hypothetical protein
VESAFDGALISGELRNFSVATDDGTSVHKFLLAKISSYSSQNQTEDAIGVHFVGGRSGQRRFSEDFTFVNGPKGLIYDWKTWGNVSGQRHAGISAYVTPDGSISVYLFVGPDHGVGNASIEFTQGPNVTIYPNPQPVVPIGEEVFSSDDPRRYPSGGAARIEPHQRRYSWSRGVFSEPV